MDYILIKVQPTGLMNILNYLKSTIAHKVWVEKVVSVPSSSLGMHTKLSLWLAKGTHKK
jgi:hypothetical protein